jgi:hypothetical protein
MITRSGRICGAQVMAGLRLSAGTPSPTGASVRVRRSIWASLSLAPARLILSPVPVRAQHGEDLVELLIPNAARDPRRHRRPVQVAALRMEPLHRIAMRMHRRRIHLARSHDPRSRSRPVPLPPVRPDRVARQLQPPAEIPAPQTGSPYPTPPRRPQEPEPARQTHAIRMDVNSARPAACTSKYPPVAATAAPSASTSR